MYTVTNKYVSQLQLLLLLLKNNQKPILLTQQFHITMPEWKSNEEAEKHAKLAKEI
jgi:hypothetical protein